MWDRTSLVHSSLNGKYVVLNHVGANYDYHIPELLQLAGFCIMVMHKSLTASAGGVLLCLDLTGVLPQKLT